MHTSNSVIKSYPISMKSSNSKEKQYYEVWTNLIIKHFCLLGDEYSAESNCSSLTHSRDQSPCNRTINNQEVSNPQKVK